MSWKPEVIADDSGKWVGNAIRFETQSEAYDYVLGLQTRWSLVRKVRVVESDDPVTHTKSPTGHLAPVRS